MRGTEWEGVRGVRWAGGGRVESGGSSPLPSKLLPA